MALNRIEVLPGLRASTYRPHPLHGEDAVWQEKNCYADLWIELLHTLQLEPLAMFSCTHCVDFEGDQWTFFKPPHAELRDLYGIDVQELTVWRPLLEHALEHLQAGKFICCEADAYWLPDTAGTDYRLKHSKTTILLASIDMAARQLGYFHNAGYFELSGDDFNQLFRLAGAADPAFLPLFAELVRIDRLVRRPPAELAERAFELLRRHFEHRPLVNPFPLFGSRLAQDMPELHSGGLSRYHAWAFASVRQAGAAFELAAAQLRWLGGWGHPELMAAAQCFDVICQGNKALIFKGARAVNAGRPLDAGPLILQMGEAWEQGMALLGQGLMPAAPQGLPNTRQRLKGI